jgi:hypothetical protein
MEWHINDLSLCGQFADPHAFKASIEPILRLRQKRDDLKRRILCSRNLYLRPVTPTYNVQQAIFAAKDPTYKRLALEWFANSGPFWDDTRVANTEDYFHFEGEDVTDQGLGEAARRLLNETSAGSISFLDSHRKRFEQTPLVVNHGLPEDPLDQINIANFWLLDAIAAAAVVPPSSWPELLATAAANLDQLIFSDEILSQLRPNPFYQGISDRILDLLGILQVISTETREDSSLSPRGLELQQMHFVGEKASFTDESEDNKRTFKAEMTFRDPADTSRKLFCPWHGKVKIGQYRIHFEWPIPKGQRKIKVAYIGPKITKR